jgi:hypothetical protein
MLWRTGTDGYRRVLREGRGSEIDRWRRMRLRVRIAAGNASREENWLLRLTLKSTDAGTVGGRVSGDLVYT